MQINIKVDISLQEVIYIHRHDIQIFYLLVHFLFCLNLIIFKFLALYDRSNVLCHCVLQTLHGIIFRGLPRPKTVLSAMEVLLQFIGAMVLLRLGTCFCLLPQALTARVQQLFDLLLLSLDSNLTFCFANVFCIDRLSIVLCDFLHD